MTLRWEHFPHQADLGIRGLGPTREAAFEQAALALTAAVTNPQAIRRRTRIAIECHPEANDELLLYAWLNAVVYEMAVHRVLLREFAVQIDDRGLRAEAWGETIDPAAHQPAVEVKGATMTELAVRQCGDGWLAQCVIDV